MTGKPFSKYAGRNGIPILDVLEREFEDSTNVLEIGSGTGQHAALFAASLTHLTWQTSDLENNHAGIAAWLSEVSLPNLLPPLLLDVRTDTVTANAFDAVYSSNTAHIMSIAAVDKMFALVASVLHAGGVFCLYGPFRQAGEFNTQSNAAFDGHLRAQDNTMGIRDIEALDDFGYNQGMERVRLYAMPANNHIAVWQKSSQVSRISD